MNQRESAFKAAIRKYIEEGYIELIRTPTLQMLADGFTKPHAHVRLNEFTTGLGLSDPGMS
jgi:hypothetical protein